MASTDFSQAIVAVIAALSAVALTHHFTSRRDRTNKLREQRIAYLMSAYRALCKANNHPRLHEVADDVEQAVADIQLLALPSRSSSFRHSPLTSDRARRPSSTRC